MIKKLAVNFFLISIILSELKIVKEQDISEQINQNQIVVIGFYDPKSFKGQQLKNIFKKISKQQNTKNYIYLLSNSKKLNKKFKDEKSILTNNEIHLYIYQHKKRYHGKLDENHVYQWLLEIINSQVQIKNNQSELSDVDSHYFVYVQNEYYQNNQEKLQILSHLIHPYSLITGFNQEEEIKLFKTSPPQHNVLIYRQYQKQIIPVPMSLTLLQQSIFIEQNEHPDFMYVCKESNHIIFHLKIPTFIYYYKDKNQKFLQELQALALYYKEYFILTIVDVNKKDKYTKKMIDFLEVKEFPSIRILNLEDQVKRFKYIGEQDIEIVEYFIQNYLHDHLKPYRINEFLTQKKKQGLKKTNFQKLVKLIKDPQFNTVVYSYTNLQNKKTLKQQLKTIKQVQDYIQASNKDLRFFVIDGDKNDLDKHYHEHYPMLFLIKKGFKVKAFQGKLNEENLLRFLAEQIKNLKIPIDEGL